MIILIKVLSNRDLTFIGLVEKLKEVVFFLKLKELANKELANIAYTKRSYRFASSSSS